MNEVGVIGGDDADGLLRGHRSLATVALCAIRACPGGGVGVERLSRVVG